jgi:hypothetical protein
MLATGGVASSRYVAEVGEQAEVFTPLLLVAWNVVVELGATVMPIPGEANVVSEPEAAGVPLQAAFVKRSTVDAFSAVPITFGVVVLPGETGLVPVIVGAPGSVESST